MNDELQQIERELAADLERTIAAVGDYARRLSSGEDPNCLSWSDPARPYQRRINNAHRVDQGLPPVPAAPSSADYDLLVHMVERPGEWLPHADLKKMIHGGAVGDRIERDLRGSTWTLERRDDRGRVEYRLVERAEVTA